METFQIPKLELPNAQNHQETFETATPQTTEALMSIMMQNLKSYGAEQMHSDIEGTTMKRMLFRAPSSEKSQDTADVRLFADKETGMIDQVRIMKSDKDGVRGYALHSLPNGLHLSRLLLENAMSPEETAPKSTGSAVVESIKKALYGEKNQKPLSAEDPDFVPEDEAHRLLDDFKNDRLVAWARTVD